MIAAAFWRLVNFVADVPRDVWCCRYCGVPMYEEEVVTWLDDVPTCERCAEEICGTV